MLANTPIFPWNENFDTGINVIDDQHRKLIDLLNNLASHLAFDAPIPELNRIFDELSDYAAYHFGTEEAIWREYLADDDMYQAHDLTHSEFVNETIKLKACLAQLSGDQVIKEVVSFLTHWLAFHILETDKHMAKIVLAIQQGSSLPDAKAKATAGMSGAARVLIETVLTMYDSLSSRTLDLMREIVERQRVEQNLRLSKKVIDSTLEAIFITDPDCCIIDTNPAFCIEAQRSHDELIGMKLAAVMPNLFNPDRQDEILKLATANSHWAGEIMGRSAKGEMVAIWLTLSVIRNRQGTITHYVGVLSSISQLIERQQSLVAAANHDVLTGLPNRRLLQDRLQQAIARNNRNGRLLAVCFLDLDGFKWVNDNLGHDAGDEVLKEIAGRLSKVVRGEDTIARLGGDEFVLLFGELEQEHALSALLDRLLQDIARPILIQGEPVHVTASIGITLSPDDRGSPDELLHHADTAMYSSKNLGKSQYQFYRI
jgi:diguanylate cyclase (GGDEF)-like protein/hemerythrin-like metal-binding protein/PAS domain S-box-containing protein